MIDIHNLPIYSFKYLPSAESKTIIILKGGKEDNTQVWFIQNTQYSGDSMANFCYYLQPTVASDLEKVALSALGRGTKDIVWHPEIASQKLASEVY